MTPRMASPSSIVLGTYELLENILLNLPLNHLFVVRQVAISWKDLIKRSESLQKKMLLLPDGRAMTPRDDDLYPIYPTKVQMNPALHRHPRPGKEYYPWDDIPPILSPSLGGIKPSLIFDGKHYPGYDIRIWSGQDACSGRDMLLTQPPITSLLYVPDDDRDDYNDGAHLIYRVEGFKLGDLMDLQKEFIQARAQDLLDQEKESMESHIRRAVDLPTEIIEARARDLVESQKEINEGHAEDYVRRVWPSRHVPVQRWSFWFDRDGTVEGQEGEQGSNVSESSEEDNGEVDDDTEEAAEEKEKTKDDREDE